MSPIKILFISIEGNTRSFVKKLADYAAGMHDQDSQNPVVQLKEISEQTDFADETDPYFAFVPTYLDGGNGIDNGVKELMTNALGEYIGYEKNASLCHGIVGSGNKNFNEQYCLTAKRYASEFNVPFLADYELRGTGRDVERIYDLLKQS
ncbi:class Ib ribonucleoside-diphosphate reductase assembly flavoprotein NrdI [Lentilactobacillus sp. TOM.63]|uniref:class Ib ribonucleoside-diphosphate reductase assembly flavoprotein NrdI n=1 Tax=Lentilactobacillus TaxID=2767893 RepID=UPI001C26BA2B|nr:MULTISPECIES: class Ib ribonucleoside-diphosphate reductase assembly flavoprotein NrdI [Lentilactobacillus]MBU9789495.1 class Ib ribonucleoside-diphosphate reductase assembly flavoprotein NrdI [Lentilactobacillus dabitei]MDM7516996.1 class Ib ribonucleoside-diphosphate reductase assembly flavoprotein NrdI [Lentilactobacillus sp. TOM.63]